MMPSRAYIGGASALPSPAMLESAIRRLSRAELADLCEQLIDRLDTLDPDPDVEWNGDELDGSASEDEFMIHAYSFRSEPGCPIADPDEAVDDKGCDEDSDREPDDDCERWHQPAHLN